MDAFLAKLQRRLWPIIREPWIHKTLPKSEFEAILNQQHLHTTAYIVEPNKTTINRDGDLLVGFISDEDTDVLVTVNKTPYALSLKQDRFHYALNDYNLLPMYSLCYANVTLELMGCKKALQQKQVFPVITCIWASVDNFEVRHEFGMRKLLVDADFTVRGKNPQHFQYMYINGGYGAFTKNFDNTCHHLCSIRNNVIHRRLTKVQRFWRQCVTDPNHPICKKRLLREYNNLTGANPYNT